MSKFLLLFFTTLTFSIGYCQTFIVSGIVTDLKTNETLIGVNVIAGDKGTITDLDGKYQLTLAEGSHTISFTFVGYETVTKKITLSKNLELNIKLEEASNTLDDVVISAGKFEQKLGDVPVSMAVIKPTLIQNKATVTCESIIDQVPGVQVLENQVSIRGGSGFSYGSGSRVLLMIDDMPMLAGDAGDIKWSSLPIENVAQIEVIKGASSVLYGSSALNGVINIRTAYPKDVPETKINYSSGVYMPGFGQQKGRDIEGHDTIFDRTNQQWWNGTQYYTTGNFLHSRKINNNFDLVVGGNFYTNEGYRLGADEHRFRFNANTRWRSKKIKGLSYGINGNRNQEKGNLFFLWQNADSVLVPQGLTDTATTTLSQYYTTRTNLDPFIVYFDTSGNKHSLRGRLYNTSNRNNTNQNSFANVAYGEYQFQKHFKNELTFTTGITGTVTEVKSQLYGDHSSRNFAVFAQADKKWRRFNFTGGLRMENYKIDTVSTRVKPSFLKDTIPVKPVFRLGTTYRVLEETYLRASYGEGYRFPSIAEKFITTKVGGLTLFPNQNVQPETGWSAEVGVKQGFKIGNFKGYLDIAGFVTEYNNMMEFAFGVYDSTGNPWNYDNGFPSFANFGFQSRNVENARISGGEISVAGQGKIKQIGIGILAGYTYIDPRSLNTDSLYQTTFSDSSAVLKYRNKHTAKLDIEFSYKKFAFGVSNRYNSFTENIDAIFTGPLGNLLLPGYPAYRNIRRIGDYVVDARFSYQATKNGKIAVLMNNVLNREYSNRPGNVMPPRTLIFQMSFNF